MQLKTISFGKILFRADNKALVLHFRHIYIIFKNIFFPSRKCLIKSNEFWRTSNILTFYFGCEWDTISNVLLGL